MLRTERRPQHHAAIQHRELERAAQVHRLEHLPALAVRHLPQRLSTGGAAERQTPAAAHHLAVAGERVVTPDRCTTRDPGRRPPVQCEAAEETGRPVLALGKELVPGVAQLERVRHRTEVAGPAHHAVAAQAALELNEPGRERVVQLLVEPAGHTTREVRRRLGVGPLHPAGERSTQGLADDLLIDLGQLRRPQILPVPTREVELNRLAAAGRAQPDVRRPPRRQGRRARMRVAVEASSHGVDRDAAPQRLVGQRARDHRNAVRRRAEPLHRDAEVRRRRREALLVVEVPARRPRPALLRPDDDHAVRRVRPPHRGGRGPLEDLDRLDVVQVEVIVA